MKAETIVRFVDKSLAKQITNFRLAGLIGKQCNKFRAAEFIMGKF